MAEGKTFHQHVYVMLHLEFLIYRIHLLSPFQMLPNIQFSCTIQIKVYMCTMFVSYMTLRILFMIENNAQSLQYFLKSGNLWFSILTFDFIFETFSFACIVFNSLWTRAYQIKFFQILNQFDVILFDVFNVPKKCFQKHVRIARWILMLCLLHFAVSIYNTAINGILQNVFNSFQQFAYIFTSYFDYSLSVLVAILFIHCTEMCRERLVMIKQVLRSRIILTTSHLEAIFQLYSRICILIVMINNFMGFVILLKMFHDLSLGTSVAYLYLTTTDWGDDQGISSINFFKQFLLTIAGTFLMSLFADFLMTEVGVYLV